MKKKKKNLNLPQFVTYESGRGYVFRPYLGRVNGKNKYATKRIKLGGDDATEAEIWIAYHEITVQKAYTLGWLVEQFCVSSQFKKNAARTQKDRLGYVKKIREFSPDFFDVELDYITKRSIRLYLDSYPAPIQANRHISFLQTAWNWCEERYQIPPNPCIGVKPNEESGKTRYVYDDEYEQALECSQKWQFIAMELAYWCRARRDEVLSMKYSEMIDGAVKVNRTKKSQSEYTVAERIKEIVQMSKSLPGYGVNDYIVRSTKGVQVTHSAWNSAQTRMKGRMKKRGYKTDWTIHDLKAKGLTDMENGWAGHRSKRAQAVYERMAMWVEPVYVTPRGHERARAN